jgi:AraC-like DNA-binding protein
MTVSHSEYPVLPQKGMVRVGPLRAIPDVLRELGVPPGPLLCRYGLSEERLLDDPDATVPYAMAGSLLKACVQRTGCPWFGLLVGQRGNASQFGVAGFLLKHAPDVRTALNDLVANLDLHDRGATPFLKIEEENVLLGYEIYAHDIDGTDQIYDQALATGFNLMKSLCGPQWAPTEVRFRHGQPASIEPYRRLFRAALKFDAGHSCLVFPTRWLMQPVSDADPLMRLHFEEQLAAMRRHSHGDFRKQAYQALVILAVNQGCTLDELAAHFSIHRRTLNRRLKEAGTTYRELHNEVRCELARKLLRDTRASITSISSLLGYSDATAFIRAFTQWEGSSPTKWRKVMKTPTAP